MISGKFIKSSLIYTLSGALPMASALILLPFYIYFLSTDTLGAMWIYLAFSLLIQILVTFSFDSSVYIHFHEYRNDSAKLTTFLSSAFLLIAFIALGVAVILIISGEFIFDLIYPDKSIAFYPYGIIALFIGAFQSFFKVYSSLLQTRQKPELFLKSNLLSFSLIAGFTVLGLNLFPGSLIGPLGARLIAAVISGGWSFTKIAKEFGLKFNTQIIRSVFSFNFFSFIYQLQQWTMNYFDRILMSFYLPLADVGIYGFAVGCLLAIDFLLNGLYSSFAPKIIGLIAEQDEKGSTPEINRYFNGLTVIAMVLVAFCILVFPIVIQYLIHKPRYQLSIKYIPYVSLIYLFKTMRLYFGIPYGILKYNKPLPIIYLFVAGIKVGLMIFLIRDFGIYGIIASSLVSYWVEVILLYANQNNKFNFKFNILKMVVAPVVLAMVIALFEIIVNKQYTLVVHTFYLVACMGLILWAFRNEVKLIDPFKILQR